jgi:hypothetical protein
MLASKLKPGMNLRDMQMAQAVPVKVCRWASVASAESL